ncbi:AAA family ATPase [Ochrobactrum tritici]|uniref:AAA family ATPase n=1 Tax=Brucella tritici TaxID=94626 RepID=A0A7X6FSS1_9HYPH|nr:AAA family ATPase [Brucella tritici]
MEGVYRELGYEVHGISPSWKAAGGLRDELSLRDEVSKALAKWIADHKVGKFSVTDKTIVIIDEAGMAGMAEMEYITRVVSEAGGRIVMLGDIQQLSPVAAGSPMALSLRVNGGHRLNVIMRQKDDTNEESKRLTARYREASAEFVLAGQKAALEKRRGSRKDADIPGQKKKFKINPHIEKALRIYYEEGRMSFETSAEATYHASADRYVKALGTRRGI